MKQGQQWSCIVLHENGFWEQPCFLLDFDTNEELFTERVLKQFGRKYFGVVCISQAEDYPQDCLTEWQ
jgi:hypothetical protein